MEVTEVTQPVSLYLDEMIPTVLAVVLRQYGYDVLTAKEADMLAKSDEEQLVFAALNRKDFDLLHQSWFSERKKHFGIIVSPEIRISKLIHLCLRLLGRTENKDLINQLRFLQESV